MVQSYCGAEIFAQASALENQCALAIFTTHLHHLFFTEYAELIKQPQYECIISSILAKNFLDFMIL